MVSGFENLGLGTELLRAVGEAGYSDPTPIQTCAIPQILMNRDVLGCAQTGTGKTASFTLPMIEVLSHGRTRARMPRSLILTPTRELAAQVAENFRTYGKHHKLATALLIGGVSLVEQEKLLSRGVDVLIATPGRLLDHFERGGLLLSDTRLVVIDEADRMLDMGFVPDVERILSLTPPNRQTLMFSATMPKEVRRLAEKFLHNAKEITVDPPSSTADTVEQGVAAVGPRQKRSLLCRWLDSSDITNSLVFCNRKREVASLFTALIKKGYAAGALHGDMDQHKRMECLDSFRSGEIRFLICSDVAARGLDIPAVSHVFNYDVPIHAEDYVHRIGRTGRAGRTGVAWTMATEADEKYLKAIEKLIGGPIPKLSDSGNRGKNTANVSATANKGTSGKPKKSARSPRKNRRASDRVMEESPAESVKPFGESNNVPAFLKRPYKG